MVTERATRTEVDGIHLDDARYASDREGYHPAALARFRTETGTTGTPAPDEATWSEWRGEQAAWFRDWLGFQAALAAEADARVVPGVGGWLNTPDAVLRQLGAAAEVADGVELYSYQQPTDHPDARNDLPGVRRFWCELDQADWGWSG